MAYPLPSVYKLTFASGATSTNSVFIGNYRYLWLYQSGLTAFNAGTGNMNMKLIGGWDSNVHADSVSLLEVDGSSITTMNGGKVHRFYTNHYIAGIPRVAIEFGTAVTGGSENSIYLIAAQ